MDVDAACSQPPRWRVPGGCTLTRYADGRLLAFDHELARTWTLTGPAFELLQALRAGWQPGLVPPASLAAHLAGVTPADLAEVLRGLVDEGLLRDGDAPKPPPVRSTRRWFDVRLPVARVRSPAGAASRVIVSVSRMAPWVAIAVLIGVPLVHAMGANGPALATWTTFRDAAPGWLVWANHLAAVALLLAVHELGHALTLSAATGTSTTVGLRLYYGLPQAYAEVGALVTLPERRLRVSVLLGGIAGEGLLLLLLTPWVMGGGAPPLVAAMVLFAGPLALGANLIPLFHNDGYFVLQELTGEFNVAPRGEMSLAVLLGLESEPSEPHWLPWYGLLRVLALLALQLGLPALIGAAFGAPVIGMVLGATLAAGTLLSLALRLRAQHAHRLAPT